MPGICIGLGDEDICQKKQAVYSFMKEKRLRGYAIMMRAEIKMGGKQQGKLILRVPAEEHNCCCEFGVLHYPYTCSFLTTQPSY